jgi:hypothetical protein
VVVVVASAIVISVPQPIVDRDPTQVILDGSRPNALPRMISRSNLKGGHDQRVDSLYAVSKAWWDVLLSRAWG